MDNFDIYRIDVHAMRVLILVHKLGSVSDAAVQLNMNQSSVSYTLDRLRKAFKDPLFVRIGRTIEPTRHCNEIVPQLQVMVGQYERLTRPSSFDPSTARDRFVVSGNFFERCIIYPPLVHRLRQAAPQVRLAILQANTAGDDQLERGVCDVVVSPVQGKSSGFYRKKLFDEHYVCFVDPQSRYARSGISLAEYASARHLLVNYADGWRPYYHDVLQRLGIVIEPSVELPSFGAIERVVSGTDLVVTAASRLQRIFDGFLVSIPAPFACSFPVFMSWTGRTHESAGHRWLRSQISRISDDIL